MKDIASKRTKTEGAKSAPSERTLMLAEVVRENLFAFVVREGMKALDVLLERDREALCGPAYTRGPATSATSCAAALAASRPSQAMAACSRC